MKVSLTVTHGPHAGKSFTFEEHDNFIVGRASYAHFRLSKKDRYFSRVHFVIEINPPLCRLVDMGSRNGTYVNEKRVKTVDIHDGDLIKGGLTLIRVSIEDDTLADAPLPDASFPRPTGARLDDGENMDDRVAADQTVVSPAYDAEPRPVTPIPELPIPAALFPEPPRDSASIESPGKSPAGSRTEKGEHIPSDETLPEATRALLPDDYSSLINNRPQPVPGYLMVDELGRGRLGIVFLAIARHDHSVVALKTIKPAVRVTAADLSRFLRETSVFKELDHPNIVAFHEIGEAAGRLFFVMDYVPATDAAQLLEENGPLDIPQAVGILCQLLLALDYAHQQGLVHRDIKPRNLLLAQHQGRGIVKLSDFGLSYAYQSSRFSGLTMTEDARETSQFMTPEQITSYRDMKPSSDQYAAAATLYRLLTNENIFDFPDTVHRKFQMILQEEPVSIQSRRADIPDELAEIIHRALKRKPEDRFADVAEMRQKLVEFLNSP